MPTPVVSVIMPVYNSERFLAAALDSVLASTLSAIEVICIDDGSTDSSPDIIAAYQNRDQRVRHLTQEHQYAGAARNAGIKAATGAYIHFLDSDDLVAPDAYAQWVRYIEQYQADVAECLYVNIDAKTEEPISHPTFWQMETLKSPCVVSIERNPATLTYGSVVPWNKLYVRKFLVDNGILFDDLICAEDRSFYFEVIHTAKRIVRVPNRWLSHRLNNAASLDGSDIRLVHFEVETKSFERIWEIVKDAPEDTKRMTLDTCIGDSLYFYRRTIGTEYEQAAGDLLYKFWEPYIPLLGTEIPTSKWYETLHRIVINRVPEGYRAMLNAIYDLHLEEVRHQSRLHTLQKKTLNAIATVTKPFRKSRK